MILQAYNLSLLYIVLNLVFFYMYKFLSFSVVLNIKGIIIYNYITSCEIYFYSISIIFKK